MTPPPVSLLLLSISVSRWLCSSKVAEVTGTAQSKSVSVPVQVFSTDCEEAVLVYFRSIWQNTGQFSHILCAGGLNRL